MNDALASVTIRQCHFKFQTHNNNWTGLLARVLSWRLTTYPFPLPVIIMLSLTCSQSAGSDSWLLKNDPFSVHLHCSTREGNLRIL